MAKFGTTPRLRVVEPVGAILDAPVPIAVRFRLNWLSPFDTGPDLICTGWAIAWTADAGLVVWRSGESGVTAWLPAGHIRRGWTSPDDEEAIS